MDIIDIIDKKKRGKKLTPEEIGFFVNGAVSGTVPDYQLSALLMAIRLNGMDGEETYSLTRAMKYSGEVLDTSFAGGVTVDKHSTGGVSDTVTLIAVPVLADAGLKAVKLSGRGLSHTGGTIDKLESIPGFNACLTNSEIISCVKRCGAVITAQTQKLAPADKVLYALRDVTATVDSIPLIASSIMGKKLASGSDIILLDVKYGSGAFMKTAKEATALAKRMVETGIKDGKKCAALITSMEQPLTGSIGCNLEVKSAVNVLKGEKNDLFTVSKEICARLFMLSGLADKIEKAYKIFDQSIQGGGALKKFGEIIRCQGGDASVLDRPDLLPEAPYKLCVRAEKSGYVSGINGEAVGKAVCKLGGGRETKDAAIDHSAGIKLKIRLNGKINQGDIAAELYTSDKSKFLDAEKLIKSCYTVSDKKVKIKKLVYAYITAENTLLL